MAFSLRPIRPEDDPEIAGLIRKIFREFGIDRPGTVYTDPTTDHLYELFQSPGSCYWIAESWNILTASSDLSALLHDQVLTGGCGVYPTPGLPTGCAELVKFYVSAESRGQGIGLSLMERCFESARQMGYGQLYLETLPELAKAVSMYERAGFRFIPQRLGDSGHYSCHIWMIKEL
jgi:putative acetyltransferase